MIPEPAYTEAEYDRLIFQPMLAEIAPLDPDGVLQEEFLNARGAIARFSRGAIEIRLLDVQETPQNDVAICAAIVKVLQTLVSERWTALAAQQAVEIEPLEQLLRRTIREADGATLDDPDYLRHFGAEDLAGGTVGDLWRRLLNEASHSDREFEAQWGETLNRLLNRGPLSRAILQRLGDTPDADTLRATYRELGECLATGRTFV